MIEESMKYRVWVETPGCGEPGFLEIERKIDFATREEAEKEIVKLTRHRRIGKANFTFTVVEVDPAVESLGPMPIAELHIGRKLEVALNAEFDQKWQEYTKRRT